MRIFCVVYVFLLPLFLLSAGDTLRILTVGNSFADNATEFLPALAEAGGKKLVLGKANVGGGSLEMHAARLRAAEKGGKEGEAYGSKGEPRRFTLPALLASQAWDVVTIQQASRLSYMPESYQPFAGEIIAAIRTYAPKAEIVVHETWAYREDAPLYQEEGGPGREGMHGKLAAAYRGLADAHGFRILPVGDAFELARCSGRWAYRDDPAFDFRNPLSEALPDQSRSLYGGWYWTDSKEKGRVFLMDPKHANTAGKYLGACVWYLMLFGGEELSGAYRPNGLAPEAAASLRDLAKAAVRAERERAAGLGKREAK